MPKSKHILFVCQSCRNSTQEKQDKEQSDGANLLNQLINLHQNWTSQSELEIQAVNCLWACSHPCVVAFSGSNKYTYLFTDLPFGEAAPALLQLGEHYLESEDGTILWKKFPELLQSVDMAQIPPLPQG
jgi:predicted metal-binding protein